jgi:hypothetical protein
MYFEYTCLMLVVKTKKNYLNTNNDNKKKKIQVYP